MSKNLREILEDHPNKVAVICNKAKKSEDLKLKRYQFLVDKDVAIASLISAIRNQKKNDIEMSYKAIVLFLGYTTLTGNITIGEIYQQHKIDINEPLNIEYMVENTFG